MVRIVKTPSHRKSVQPDIEDNRELVTAAEDADLQAHHRLLLCLEQTRRAQLKMAQDWTEDLLATGRTLAGSTDPQRWLQAPAGLLGAAFTHLIAAQGTTLSAWSEFQYALLDEMRRNMGVAGRCVWPFTQEADASEHPAPITPAWLEDAMKTYEKFAAAYGSAWAPDGAGTPSHH